MRMRTLNEAFKYIQDNDPETCLTKSALRRLVTTGKLPSVKVGTKYLISLEILESTLKSGFSVQKAPEPQGKIRPINI